MRHIKTVIAIIALSFFSEAASAKIVVYSADEKAALAKEFADLFMAFKVSIFKLQGHINNPDIGDKGLNGASMVEHAKREYRNITGKDFVLSQNPDLLSAQLDLFQATNSIMHKMGPVINRKGLGFKGFITAIFVRMVAKEFSSRSSRWNFKFTAPDDLLRSRANAADGWEGLVFQDKFRKDNWQTDKTYSEDTSEGYRWMMPIYHTAVCLSCHGGPKGSRDITGSIKEGARLGDLAGAFSIVFSTKP